MENQKKVMLSGIQPSGDLTLGSYLGAIKNWSERAEIFDCYYFMADLHSITVRQNPADLRRRTRIGMGTCQGELCACRAAGLLQRFNVTTPAQSLTQLSEFLNERWKGVQPIAWGDALRESEFTRWVYLGLCGLPQEHRDEV